MTCCIKDPTHDPETSGNFDTIISVDLITLCLETFYNDTDNTEGDSILEVCVIYSISKVTTGIAKLDFFIGIDTFHDEKTNVKTLWKITQDIVSIFNLSKIKILLLWE